MKVKTSIKVRHSPPWLTRVTYWCIVVSGYVSETSDVAWTSRMIYVVESAQGNKGLYGALLNTSGTLAFITATASSAAMRAAMDSEDLKWAWRIPFLAVCVWTP